MLRPQLSVKYAEMAGARKRFSLAQTVRLLQDSDVESFEEDDSDRDSNYQPSDTESEPDDDQDSDQSQTAVSATASSDQPQANVDSDTDISTISQARWNTATSMVQDTNHPRAGDQSRT